jgi:2,3-dihydroxybenzoate-AMP ligase
MPRPVLSGFVAWPDDVAARYREAGWWAGEPLGRLPDTWAFEWPEDVAVIDEKEEITFAYLARRVNILAASLLRIGLRGGSDGDRILVQLPNISEFIVLVLACFRVGVVPILALPAHRENDLRRLVELSEARAIAVPRSFRGFDHAALAGTLADELPTLEHVLVAPIGDSSSAPAGQLDLLALATSTDGEPLAATHPHPDPSQVALLLLSGGTTGGSKLIPRTHDDYLYNIRATAQACEFGRLTTFLASLPVSHNFGLGCPGVLGALEAGGRVAMVTSPEPVAALDAINRHRVTDVAVVPAVLQRWMDEVRKTHRSLPSLRAITVGGARLPEEIARQVGPTLGATLQQALGMAEGLINYTRLDDPVDVACQTQGRPVSPGDEVRIVDESGDDVAAGAAGELLTRGPYTIRGYWRADEHNARAFTPDGWYRTGDLVRWHPSGNLVVEGRVKDVINRGGEKISADEVENLLYQLPGISRAAVVAAADPTLGERVAAVIVPAAGAPKPSLEYLRHSLATTGTAAFKIPELLLVVDELPLTKVGKVDKSALRRAVSATLPTSGT